MRLLSLALAASLFVGCAEHDASPPPVDPPPTQPIDLAAHFDEAGAIGTFVLVDPVAGDTLIHDPARASQRFLPASTFKIPNALIALDLGVVADSTAQFSWDGTERSYAPWNADHTLATAFEHSVVWVFQQIARQIGPAPMAEAVRRADYGNADIGGGIDRFWLDGAIRISAREQVDFLQRLHERTLPFSDAAMETVEGIMVEERGPRHVLRAKTGWGLGEPTGIGWYVGSVERADRAVYFALNMDMNEMAQAPARRAIARAILVDAGYLDPPDSE